MEFLYPISRQYPFDEVCEQIVRELEKRNWQVPGIDVEFHEYGSGEQKFRTVSRIKGRDFKLWFCRVQRTLPGGLWNDTAAVTEIVIPKKELHIHEDESGPTFYLYVGNDYDRDRENFMNDLKVHSRLDGKPRMYLKYTGGCDCLSSEGASFEAMGFLGALLTGDAEKLDRMTHTHRGERSSLLVHTNDLKREYDPKRKEPKVFDTDKVMEEFRQYLTGVVLEMIMSQPIPTKKIDSLALPDPIPFPESVGPLYCFGKHEDAYRIEQGKTDPAGLRPHERFGLVGKGYRLLMLSVSNDGTVPNIAYEGFLWCGIGEVTSETHIETVDVPGHHRWSDEAFLIRVKPDRANDIYIADHAEYEKRREELANVAQIEGRELFTDKEIGDFERARARTIVPISEYQGGFEQPVVLVNRELSLDEVEIVTGPKMD